MKVQRFGYTEVNAPGSVYTLTARTFAIAIDTESELDQCFVRVLGADADGPVYPGLVSNVAPGSVVRGGFDVVKVAVGAPYLCDLPAGTQIEILPSRAQSTAIAAAAGLARVSLAFAELPCHLPALPRKRAALDVEWTQLVTADVALYVPIYGRQIWGVDVHATTVSGGVDLDTTLTVMRGIWDAAGAVCEFTETEVLAATLNSFSFLDDEEVDLLRLDFGLSSAGSARALIHVRGED